MTSLGDAIRAEGEISTRPSQLDRLERIASMVEEIEKDRDQWREKYIASLHLNDDLIKGVERLRGEAWDEGWEVGQRWAFTDLDEYHRDTNPYRGDA